MTKKLTIGFSDRNNGEYEFWMVGFGQNRPE
jgi:hypothetical protein